MYQKFHTYFPKLGNKVIYRAFQVIRTFLLMSCLRLFDTYGSVRGAFCQFIHMFTDLSDHLVTRQELLDLGLTGMDYIILGIGVTAMLLVSLVGRTGSVRKKLVKKPYVLRYLIFVSLFFCVLLFGTYGPGYDVQQFIYNQY